MIPIRYTEEHYRKYCMQCTVCRKTLRCKTQSLVHYEYITLSKKPADQSETSIRHALYLIYLGFHLLEGTGQYTVTIDYRPGATGSLRSIVK